MSTKTTIKNRNGIDIAVVIEGEANKSGLAFVLHGLAGFKEQIHIRSMAEAFLENDYIVVTYDAANTIGESGGKMEEATLTNYFEDFEDVAEWASSRPWYQEPYVIAGHSLGGACSIMYATKYPQQTKAIIPVSSFISGENYRQGFEPEFFTEWEAKGILERKSTSRPGDVIRTGWVFVQDADTHDLTKQADKITCPALFITGEFDKISSPQVQQLLIDKMPNGAELEVIKGMDHNPRSPEHNSELKELIANWVKKLR